MKIEEDSIYHRRFYLETVSRFYIHCFKVAKTVKGGTQCIVAVGNTKAC